MRISLLPGRLRRGSSKKDKKKEVSDFLVIGYLYSENTCNFIYVTSFLIFSWLLSSK